MPKNLRKQIYLVKRYNEGRLTIPQQAQRLQSLRLQAVHDINDKDGNVTQGTSTRTQIRERLVSWRVNNQETGDFVLLRAILYQNLLFGVAVRFKTKHTLFMTKVLVLMASKGKYVAPICCVIPPASPSWTLV